MNGRLNNALLNNALLRLPKRAESSDRAKLVETFVDTGALVTLVASNDHQVIFGRRGTGKTHALLYLADLVSKKGDLVVYIDMRTIGSTGGLYADTSVPLSERATRLLADTLAAIHEGLLSAALSGDSLDLSQVGPTLDLLASACTEVVVTGPVDEELMVESTASSSTTASASLSADKAGPKVQLSMGEELKTGELGRSRVAVSGERRHRVHFGAVGSALTKLTSALSPQRLWVLLDEWSVVPLDLQPYLADLIRRAVLPVQRATLKIAAIEQRSNFQIAGLRGDYVGIELGADMSADLNLDDFMVFDNQPSRATQFFRDLLFRDYKSVETEAKVVGGPTTPQQFVSMVFTQKNPFEELVAAAEGVPRDAINVLGLSAQRAEKDPLSIAHIRDAAKTWYQRDKEAAVSANPKAKSLLHWVQDKVIAHRRARVFLIRSGERHPLVDALFDARVLHLVKRSVSAHDQPGVRYDVYKIDYGCYVDLLTTQKSPQGLLPLDDVKDGETHIDMPPDDYRAIRRAILNIAEFEEATGAKEAPARGQVTGV
jgi:hypothetical protein